MIGLKEVAERAGVSVATVSRVVNGHTGVSDETRRAVETAMRQLGHRPAGRVLSRDAVLVALVVPSLLDPFFCEFCHHAGRVLAEAGAQAVVIETPAHNRQEVTAMLDDMVRRGIRGIIFVGGMHNETSPSHEYLQRLREADAAMVLVNASIPGVELDRVMCDDRTEVQLALSHLRSLGHRRIGMLLGASDHVPSLLKSKAVAELTRGSSELEVSLCWTDFSVAAAQAEAGAALARGATALIAVSTDLVMGCLLAVQRGGLLMPEDVSLVAFSEAPVLAITSPPLTCVRQPVADMASSAVRCLVDQLRSAHQPRHLIHEPELVLRGSTGVRPQR